MSFSVYILRNPQGRLYIGQTSDVTLRLRRHNQNTVFSTKDRGPWTLVYSKEFPTRSEAMAQERKLKALKSNKALLALVADSGGSK